MNNIKVKVCGMKYPGNIREIAALGPDFMGFILYDKSKRFVGYETIAESLKATEGIKRVGVFVNDSESEVLLYARKYGFEYIQLHGDESPGFCGRIRQEGFKVIKAFSIEENFDFDTLLPYTNVCDYFLFDTKSDDYGGSGQMFNWDILKKYNNALPVFLSGGIGENDAAKILGIKDLNLFAVDINSRFETEPGLKNGALVKRFIHDLRIKK